MTNHPTAPSSSLRALGAALPRAEIDAGIATRAPRAQDGRMRTLDAMRRGALGLALSLVGCGEAGGPPVEPDAGSACTPDPAVFASDIRPRLETYCGSCHGETPQYGAPSTLLDEATLYAPRADGSRLVDRIADRIVDGSMPPVGMPRMPDADAQALVAWGSCGAQSAPPATGLRASAPVFLSPTRGPEGLSTLDLGATEHPIGPDVRDAYRCFVFEPSIAEDRFIRRFEMIFDETRVLHHLVLLRDVEKNAPLGEFDCLDGAGMPAGSEYLYAWAPGTGAFQFPEGGLRVRPGDRFLVQIHYNNGAAIPDVRDSSGVRLFLDAPVGTEYGMLAVGSLEFEVPARGTSTTTSRCTFATETRVLAGMPHMHEIGSSFLEETQRAGAMRREPLIRLDGWSFETQLFYGLPVTLAPGDSLVTSCTFENPGPEPVHTGPRTSDEMCFNFMYVTPPPATRYCDEGDAAQPTDVRYVPGACAPSGVPTDVPLVRGGWSVASAPPTLSAAPVPDGRWALEGITFFVSTDVTPVGQIDLTNTYVLGRGQIVTTAGRIAVDADTMTVLRSTEGATFGGPREITFAGPFDAASTPAVVALDCPASGGNNTFDWGLDGDRLTIGFTSMMVPGATLWPRYTFVRVPAP